MSSVLVLLGAMFAMAALTAFLSLATGLLWLKRRQVLAETAELRRSERLYRELAASSPVAQFCVDLSGTVLAWNPAAERMLGWSAEEVVGRRLPLLLDEKSERAARICSELMAGQPFSNLEVNRTRKNGTVFIGSFCGTPVYDGTGTVVGVVGSVEDVTDAKRAESALRESERRLEVLMGNLPGMAYRCRNEDGWPMEFVSEGCLGLTGYTAAELTTRSGVLYGDLIHSDDRAQVERAVEAGVRAGQPFTLEYRIRTKDGRERSVWEQGRAVSHGESGAERLEGFVADVTDRKLAEAERERLAAGIEQAAEIIVITDADGLIQYANPAFERVTGYTRAEVMGRKPSVLKSGRHDEAFYAELWGAITSGRSWNGRFVNRRKDGSLYTEEATISPVLDPSGRITNYVAVKSDISAQLALEEQYLQAQKMESVGRLAGGVAHDFNNMLSVILGHAEMMLAEAGAEGPLREGLQEIHDAALHSAELTRQLLAFARKQTIAPRVLDLNDAVSGTLRLLQRLIGERIELVWSPGSGVPPVKMDPSQLDHMLTNLCVNARDAIEGPGRITIETGVAEFGAGFCAAHVGLAPGRYATLTVSDDGCGMDEETREHLFEPFYTTKDLGAGTGLGLALVYGVTKQNNGIIQVESEPGKGAVFRIFLPECTDVQRPTLATATRRAVEGGAETVLFVEDEPAIVRSGSIMLERLGYRVLAASSPEEALRLAHEHAGSIDLLITDVVMPGMDGRELAAELQAKHPEMPCLFVSGYTAEIITKDGRLEQGIRFLQKPFTLHDLARQVRALLEPGPVGSEGGGLP